ncbi:hypothetical protein MTO96_052206 [Rhipicephalus appendiculatus]
MQETRPGLGQESPPVQGCRLPPALHELVLEGLERTTIRGSIGSKIGTQLHHFKDFCHNKVPGRYRDAVARVNSEARQLLLKCPRSGLHAPSYVFPQSNSPLDTEYIRPAVWLKELFRSDQTPRSTLNTFVQLFG